MKEFRPVGVQCPKCGKTPGGPRFSEREVRRCRIERQAAHICTVKCDRCSNVYWIRALQIAAAVLPDDRRRAIDPPTPERSFDVLPADFPGRAALRNAGIDTYEAVEAVADLTALPGVGAATAKKIAYHVDARSGS